MVKVCARTAKKKKKKCARDESRVHGRKGGVQRGVNKVSRAVARTTTNLELGLVPSQRPTHPSVVLAVLFLHLSVGQPKPQSNECSPCFCSLNGAAE